MTALPRIFVQIAAYRDPECVYTVKNLFEQAAHPERIFVGICNQYDPKEDAHIFSIPWTRESQVRQKHFHYNESQGIGWARATAQSLWQGEEYTLGIDAHMRFVKGWDEELISQLHACPTEKAILTGMLPGYLPPNDLQNVGDKVCFMHVKALHNIVGAALFNIHGGLRDPKRVKDGPFPTGIWVGNFLFCRSSVQQELPHDPYIYFHGEEMSYSIRLFTHGYDIYQPNKTILYHQWKGRDTGAKRVYRGSTGEKSQLSHQRLLHLMGIKAADDSKAIYRLGDYALGNERTLQQFFEYAGINYRTMTIAPHASKGLWPAPPPCGNVHQGPTPEVSMSKTQSSSSGKLPRIFVQIASYRDPECQWTVKDLFEKAAHPERIFVGICWQFDPEEDAHCFEIEPPLPDQVRVDPYNHQESKGVCWARSRTQALWEGEEYTLMIDSHMRFVEGWDDKMIAELDACESPKPVITCHPASYTPPNNLQENPKNTILRAHMYASDGDIRFKGEFLDKTPDKPLNGAFIAAGFIFAKADIIREVPYDPYLYFNQEEVSLAARFYTWGWDVFSSKSILLYHYYNTPKPDAKTRPLHWQDNKKWRDMQDKSRQRLDHLFGVKPATDPEAVIDLPKYALGPKRTLKQFIEYSGLDVQKKVALERGLRCEFIKDLRKYKTNPVFIPELDKETRKWPEEPAEAASVAAPIAWNVSSTVVKDRMLKCIERSYLPKTQKNVGSLVMFSGGLDSVALLANLLVHTSHNVHVHHIEIINKENRAEAENEAIAKIIPWMQQNIRPFAYTTSRSEFNLGIGGGLDLSLQMFTAGRVYNTLGGGIDLVWTGHIATTWQELTEGAAYLNANFTLKRMKPEWMVPLKDIDKRDVYDSIPPELSALCWSCRFPVYEGNIYRPCGQCHACASMLKIQNDIEKQTGKKPFDLLARREKVPERKASAPLYVAPGTNTPVTQGNPFVKTGTPSLAAAAPADTPSGEYLSALVPGQCMPFFRLPDQSGKLRDIQNYGGQCTVIHYLPIQDEAYIKKMFEELVRHQSALQETPFHRLYVFNTTPDKLAALDEKLQSKFLLLADSNGALAKACGITPPDKQSQVIALDHNLRLIENISTSSVQTAWKESIRIIKSYLGDLPKSTLVEKQSPGFLVPEAIPQELCDRLIAYFESGKQYRGPIGADGKHAVSSAKRRTDVDVNDKDLLLALDDALSKTVFAEIRKIAGYEVTFRERYKIGCYDASDEGHYVQHRDTGVPSLAYRRYSMSLCIGGDYEGGALEFTEYPGTQYKLSPRAAITFPSCLLHRVTPVTKGKRYVLVAFTYGDEENAYRKSYIESQGGKYSYGDYALLTNGRFKDLAISPDVYTNQLPVTHSPQVSIIAPEPAISGPSSVTTIPHPGKSGSLAYDEQLLANGQVRKLNIRKDVPEGVIIIEDYLEKDLCKVLADYADAQVFTKLNVVDHEKSDKTKVATAPSKGRITDHVNIDGMSGEILSIMNDIYCNRLSPFYKVNFEWYERPQILRYPAGGKYNQHADADHWVAEKKQWVRTQDRDYSVLLYLNDEYEGGELEFVNQKFKFKPKTGMVVGFPSDHKYLHAALPTTSGIRYVIVSWAAILGTPRARPQPPYASVFVRQKRY